MGIKLVEWKSDIVCIEERVYVYDMLIDLGVWVYVCVYVCLLWHVYIYCNGCRNEQERPYHDDSTASRLLSEVKHRRAWLVLRWGTTLESQVLFFCYFSLSCAHRLLYITLSNILFIHFISIIFLSIWKLNDKSNLSFYSLLQIHFIYQL